MFLSCLSTFSHCSTEMLKCFTMRLDFGVHFGSRDTDVSPAALFDDQMLVDHATPTLPCHADDGIRRPRSSRVIRWVLTVATMAGIAESSATAPGGVRPVGREDCRRRVPWRRGSPGWGREPRPVVSCPLEARDIVGEPAWTDGGPPIVANRGTQAHQQQAAENNAEPFLDLRGSG